MNYYIDGTIDSIKITTEPINAPVTEIDKAKETGEGTNHKNVEILEFSLQPSSDFLKTLAEGINAKKKALFIKSETLDMAHLHDIANNESAKDIIRFSIATQNDSSLKCLLLAAKNNRNTMRVFVKEKADKTGVELPKATAVQIM